MKALITSFAAIACLASLYGQTQSYLSTSQEIGVVSIGTPRMFADDFRTFCLDAETELLIISSHLAGRHYLETLQELQQKRKSAINVMAILHSPMALKAKSFENLQNLSIPAYAFAPRGGKLAFIPQQTIIVRDGKDVLMAPHVGLDSRIGSDRSQLACHTISSNSEHLAAPLRKLFEDLLKDPDCIQANRINDGADSKSRFFDATITLLLEREKRVTEGEEADQ